MKKIDDTMLQTLFDLSHFELKEDEKQLWCDDLNHWINFFSMESYQSPTNSYRPPCTGGEELLRADVVEPSLDVKVIKSFCPRFLDGFVALPPKNSNNEQ